MRVRVAHIVPTDRIAFFLLSTRLGQLREAGYEVTVICGEVAYADELRAQGIEVVHIPFAREIEPYTDLRCAWALYRVLRRRRHQIVHSHNPKGGLLGPVVAALARIGRRRTTAIVHTVHGFLFNDETPWLRRIVAIAAERWTAAWCDHLLFQSSEDLDYARAWRFKRSASLHLIGNGIDQSRFDPRRWPHARARKREELGWEESHLVVGMVGRLVVEKGFPEYFAMAGELARRLEQVRFLVVGITESDQGDALDPHQLCRNHGIEERTVILEQRHDMPELYTSMDVAVLPSHREGIPRAIMEASAMGVPVVATDIRGCREVIVHRQTGLLFRVGDVEAFAAVVEELLLDTALRRRLGAAGSRRVFGYYTEDRTAARLMAFYGRVLGNDEGSSQTARVG